MISTASTPGLYFTVVPRPSEVSPLRSDVAGFIGRTKRGPVGRPIRVEEWRGYIRDFGGLLADSSSTYAIRGYFDNGGQVGYVVRVCRDAKTASVIWKVGELDSKGEWDPDSPSAFSFARYRIAATSPGAWGNDIVVRIRYRMRGASGEPEVDINVRAKDEAPEYFAGIPLDDIAAVVASRSLLIRITPDEDSKSGSKNENGLNHRDWEYTLRDGDEGGDIFPEDYLQAIAKLGGEIRDPAFAESLTDPSLEVALVAVPGLYEDLESPEVQQEVLMALIDQAEQLHDRLVLIDLPHEASVADESRLVDETVGWMKALQESSEGDKLRAAAVYHPTLKVSDPLGSISKPLRCVPPSGHVAGLISRLDRERGAHHTPANAPIFEAVDITRAFEPGKQAQLQNAGVNLIRCFPGRGLVVWGGRTADPKIFVAHRRLIHRLVRAIRRVAEPLVFDINGAELRLTIVRAVTTVLLEAWRAGALKGNRPDEAFRVSCDDRTTPVEEQDLGRVICEIEVAPAVPMEFILLRVAVGAEGMLEVFE